MKKCPYCAEEIQDDAIYCRYCQHYLDERVQEPPKETTKELPKEQLDITTAEDILSRTEKEEPKKLPSVFIRALLVGIGFGCMLFVYNLQISGSFNDAFFKGISSVIIYGFLYSAIVWFWRIVIKKTVKDPLSSESGCVSAIIFLILLILFFLFLIQPFNRQLSSLETKPIISTLVPSTRIPTPKNTPTLIPSFPDTFSDNRNLWGLDNVVKIVGGSLLFQNIPADQYYRTSCANCLIDSSQNQVTVDKFPSGEFSGSGLVIDDGLCTPNLITFIVGDISGAYIVLQYIREGTNNGHWEPIEVPHNDTYHNKGIWMGSSWMYYPGIKDGQVNKLSAIYAFSKDNLTVYLYINDECVTWFQVPDYNKFQQCSVGLIVYDDHEGSFDNFALTATEVPTACLPTLKVLPTAVHYYDYPMCERYWITKKDGTSVLRSKCPPGYPTP